MILADLDHPGGESADQRRAHRNSGHENRRIEEGMDRKVGELFHTFIVNEPRARFDEVRGCFNGGVIPTPPKRRRPIVEHACGCDDVDDVAADPERFCEIDTELDELDPLNPNLARTRFVW
jgi:hypothetical protein